MTLDAFGQAGNTATAIFRFNTQSEFCFEDTVGATCAPNQFTFTFRGITTSSLQNIAYYAQGTGDFYLKQFGSYDAGATFGGTDVLILDAYEASPCFRHLLNEYNSLPARGSVLILPEDYSINSNQHSGR